LVFHHAPVLVLLHAPRRNSLARDNCIIAASNMANHAHALGLGTCFIGILVTAMQVDRFLHRRFRIPETHRVYAALTLGYPDVQHTHHVVRKPPPVQRL
jgi:nitroreductase